MDSKDILQRARAKLDKDADLRWEHELRREHNILHPPKLEREVPEVVRRVHEDGLIELPVDDINAALLSVVDVIGQECGAIKRELEERIARIEKHLGISDVVYKVHTNEQ